ncbi:hypothetical protein TTHERM_00727670 (macronuclear) [Tetrahymena thermophila SB210]|uniref:Uncharacterized protein n=1 Tax=Tetrahymena thermophila (strain SB210) TaxID=312017 RepID=I7MH11_TETTS|nr:hypothetical protein TTHERM_00727670 [Tetrahymena thermophila SB210]EAS02407.1 hypothetical protein TTHERM_00727670 [Tetrahymena thermophila SB210]|eukprot:XP_001022652.1 hypothetical protein TTHERM_00727670 [Tetrahymena thermophila SB210]
METYLRDSENKSKPNPLSSNKYNMDYLYAGPTGLKRDYESLYKALEYQTIQKLSNIENNNENLIREANFYRDENFKYQQQFDKVLNDNKALYLRCKELESYLFQTNPNFQHQYGSVIRENEDLRRQLQQNGTQFSANLNGQINSEGVGIQSSNRMLQLQREIEDLRRENYDLKVRLQAQLQDKGVPYSRSQINSPAKLSQSIYTSPPKPVISHQNYCDNVISSNEQHNRAVLERCKSIIASHNYY